MRLYKIRAMLYRDMISFSKTKERMIELLFFPVTSAIIWGMFARHYASFSMETGLMMLLINIFWSFAYTSQSTGNLQINTDVWSHSLNQLLVSGLSEVEYLVSRLVFSTVASLGVITVMTWVATWFGFVVPALPGYAWLIFACLLASSVLGILVVTLYLRLGREYAFLSWSFLQLIILLSAPFFPIETYPGFVQGIVRLLPHTWVFQAVRGLAATGLVDIAIVNRAVLISLLALVFVFPLYVRVFRYARQSGSLVRLGF
ncbi:MAG: ABC transporter permease [Candidatus Woesearchaeota archaeon]